ncbi:ABC transporter permease [Alloscardovia omnicolens]|uniref:ABC transporter permease n=1 Tax=Alloscardovia omnicolens TaxID=419015 RepID=UPI003A710919
MARTTHYVPQVRSGALGGSQGNHDVQQRGLSVLSLKIIALIFTSFSVFSTAIFPNIFGTESMVGLTLAVVSEVLSWLAVPLVAWLTVQGFKHTRHSRAYMGRVALLAVLCEIPYDYVTTEKIWDFGSQNPVWAVLLILCALSVREHSIKMMTDNRGKTPRRYTVVLDLVLFICAAVWMLMLRVGVRQQLIPLGLIMLVFAYIYYFLGLKENTMMLLSGIFGALCMITPGIGAVILHYRNDYKLGFDRDNRILHSVLYGSYLIMLLIGVLVTVLA